MPRPRTLDPLGVSDSPNVVTDPERVESLAREFWHRLFFALDSFRTARLIDETFGTVEASIARLKYALKRKRQAKSRGLRLHPEVKIVLATKEQQFANTRTGRGDARILQCDIQQAEQFVVDAIPVKQGARVDRYLRHHVEGLMALFQETSGKPVVAQRHRDSLYDPHFDDPKARCIYEALHSVDPRVSVIKVCNIICDARRAFVQKPMRFHEYFPAYSGSFELQGINFPIYCP